MAYPPKSKANNRNREIVCQDCLELFKQTEIYTVEVRAHYIFLCAPCVESRGITGKLYKEPKTRKTKS